MHAWPIRAALAALALCALSPARAEVVQLQAIPLASCGSVTLPPNDPRSVYMTVTGKLCVDGGGAGGSSTVTGSQEQDVRSTATLNAATANAAITIPINGQSTVAFTFSGLTASGATLSYEQSNDGGTTWTGVSEVNTGTGATSLTRTTDGQVRVAVQGRTGLRLRVSTTGTGTISVAWNVSVREGLVSLASPAQIAGLDGTTPRVVLVTTAGALEPATAADATKVVTTSTDLAANTSTTIAPQRATRIAYGIQCGNTAGTSAAATSVSETGATLTGVGLGPGSLFIPASSTGPAYFTPPVASRTALTAYSATAQRCVVTEYLR